MIGCTFRPLHLGHTGGDLSRWATLITISNCCLHAAHQKTEVGIPGLLA
jgi:hypothetical protein